MAVRHLELEFGSIGEMISMLRYNDSLTVADLQRPVKVTLDIDRGGAIDGSYLHIAGSVMREWLADDAASAQAQICAAPTKKKKSPAKRLIGFAREDTKDEK